MTEPASSLRRHFAPCSNSRSVLHGLLSNQFINATAKWDPSARSFPWPQGHREKLSDSPLIAHEIVNKQVRAFPVDVALKPGRVQMLDESTVTVARLAVLSKSSFQVPKPNDRVFFDSDADFSKSEKQWIRSVLGKPSQLTRMQREKACELYNLGMEADAIWSMDEFPEDKDHLCLYPYHGVDLAGGSEDEQQFTEVIGRAYPYPFVHSHRFLFNFSSSEMDSFPPLLQGAKFDVHCVDVCGALGTLCFSAQWHANGKFTAKSLEEGLSNERVPADWIAVRLDTPGACARRIHKVFSKLPFLQSMRKRVFWSDQKAEPTADVPAKTCFGGDGAWAYWSLSDRLVKISDNNQDYARVETDWSLGLAPLSLAYANKKDLLPVQRVGVDLLRHIPRDFFRTQATVTVSRASGVCFFVLLDRLSKQQRLVLL